MVCEKIQRGFFPLEVINILDQEIIANSSCYKNFLFFSLFTEILGMYQNQNFPDVLTTHSGNERLKVGIVLKSGSQKWKRRRAIFRDANTKMASFNIKVTYIRLIIM